jgi:hypothetical protein
VPLSGLEPGTTYHFRVVAENEVGSPVQGADAVFTTAPATAPSASAVTSNSATLNASVIPGETGSTYRFEYGTDTSYGASTPEGGLNPGASETPVNAGVLQLTPGTEYHFRVVATTNGQTVTGDDATFTTVPAATVTTAPVTGVTSTSATLNASIDTHGTAGTFTFLVTSPESPYTATTSSASLSATSGAQNVSVALGVPSGASYLVRVSATVAGTTVWGEQVAFSTPQLPAFTPTPPPPVSSDPYAGLTPGIGGPPTPPPPANKFAITKTSIKGSTATLTVKLSGPGKLQANGPNSTPASTSVVHASTVHLTVHLSKAAKKTLAKGHKKKLTITVRVTYTPTGGTTATKTLTITFKRGGTR